MHTIQSRGWVPSTGCTESEDSFSHQVVGTAIQPGSQVTMHERRSRSEALVPAYYEASIICGGSMRELSAIEPELIPLAGLGAKMQQSIYIDVVSTHTRVPGISY